MNEVRIKIHEYTQAYGGGNRAMNVVWQDAIREILERTEMPRSIKTVEVYNVSREHYYFDVGNRERLVILGFSSSPGAGDTEYVEGGIEVDGVELEELEHVRGVLGGDNSTIIRCSEGWALAEYDREKNEINTTIDLFNVAPTPEMTELFAYIIREIKNEVWDEEKDEMSWDNKDNRESLLKQLETVFEEEVNRELVDLKIRLDARENEQGRLMRDLRQAHSNAIHLRKKITQYEQNSDAVVDKVAADLDLLVEHEAIANVSVDGEIIEVNTEPMYMYNISNDDRHYLGEIKIRLNAKSSSIRFYNRENSRPSYWSTRDPHPHVDGRNGDPCLGNVSSTIAELSAQNEIYALILVAIDFLESADPSDPAGENISNWDKVNERGEIIEEGTRPSESVSCEECGDRVNSSDIMEVYYGHNSAGLVGRDEVCDDCCDMHFYYSEVYDEYVHEDIDDGEYN